MMMMKSAYKWIGGAILLVHVSAASAVPIISIDLDPSTAGVQSSLTVAPGTSFTVDVVLTGDGVAVFDIFAFAVDFNDSGPVLGLAPPAVPFAPGLPTAGTIAGTAPIGATDVFAPAGVAPGSPLTPSGVPFSISPGFTATSDGVGILSVIAPFVGPIPPGMTVDLFSVTFDALVSGMSTLLPSAGGVLPGLSFGPTVLGSSLPPALGGLALTGSPVDFTTAVGTVTVESRDVIPEPATLLLMGVGLAGLGFARRRRLNA